MSDILDQDRQRAGRASLHPSSVWQALDAEAAAWARDTDVAAWIARMTPDPKTREHLHRMFRLCFAEGAYRGAMNVIDGKSLQDSIEAARDEGLRAKGGGDGAS